MATIRDVARLAGVSPATVSRVFNGNRVSEQRVVAVRKAAKTLNFTPNRAARSLRTKRSTILSLIIPDIENPYFTELARGVEDVAQSAGFSLIVCNTDARLDKEEQYLTVSLLENLAGTIVATSARETRLEILLNESRPVVAVDRQTPFAIDHVVMDNVGAGRSACLALIAKGYRRIACITGPERVDTARERAGGWRSALLESHRPLESELELLRFSTFQVSGGREVMDELLRMPNPPDAVVAANNLIGVGALQVLTEHGLFPPQFGVAVVGALPFTTLSPETLTVVRLPVREMGTTAARLLLERIAGSARPPETLVLPNSVQAAQVVRSD